MARKEINVFGASFLDLLSGALGAVIILYIIVPKLTAEQSDILEQVENIDAELTELNSIIEEHRQSVPEEVYEELMAQFQAMENQIGDLQQQVQQVTRELRETRAENVALQEDNAALRNQMAAVQQETEEIRESLEAVTQELEEAQRQTDAENEAIAELEDELQAARELLAQTFLVIYIQWPEAVVDVDLHVTDPAGAEFYYAEATHPGRPGELSEDVVNGPGAEVWEVRVADPGNYLVEANLYSMPSDVSSSTTRGRIFFRDGSRPIESTTMRDVGEKTVLLRFTVSDEGDVTFQ
jgi:regulator of replication initiation timing